jgi:hypothetical protein
MFSPEHTFFGGSFIGDPRYGGDARNAGLYPFIDEVTFDKWLGQSRRGRKQKYHAAEFRKGALEVLTNMGLSFSPATFKREMLDWCFEHWGQEPRATWIKQHLALALREYEQAQQRRKNEQAQR